MKKRNQDLLPLLLDIEKDLEQDLSLGLLASRFGASEFHFHRTFAETIGETPKKHIERLRIEKAAMQLAISDTPITELAFSLGYRNLETFSRRYKAAIGYSPSAYRRMAKAAQAQRVSTHNFHANPDYFLSRASFATLPDMRLLAVRHTGDYGRLNASFGDKRNAWTELREQARAEGLDTEPVFLGIFYDDPTLTPADQRRCDVCIPLRAIPAGKSTLRSTEFNCGRFAFARYVGTIDYLLHAYQGLADEIRRSPVYTFADGAPLLFLRTPNVGGQSGVHELDVSFPVALRRT